MLKQRLGKRTTEEERQREGKKAGETEKKKKDRGHKYKQNGEERSSEVFVCWLVA